MTKQQPISRVHFKNLFPPGNLKKDLPASIVVFLVALPLCLGIALASGAPLFAGLLTGIIGGIITAAISGSHLSVSGPAAGLTVIVFGAITSLGSFDVFILAVMLAGLIQIVLGLIKAGTIGNYFPSSVIEGMLAAIGIILILKQIPHALGYDSDFEGSVFFLNNDENTFSAIKHALASISEGATIIAVLSVIILIGWPKLKKVSAIPAPLVVVILGILLNKLFKDGPLEIKDEHLVIVPIIDSFNEFKSLLITPDFSQISNPAVWTVAFTIAIVASLESLLSLEAVDKIDPLKRTSPTNRELIAQGIGNMTSGFFGGLPMTAVIVRSSANVNAGGKTKVSAILHGMWLLLSLLLIPGIINSIPLACLAAILLVTGYKLARIALFKKMYKAGWSQFIPFIITVLAVVFTDLLKGVGIGMVIGIYFVLRNNMRNPYFYTISSAGEKKVITIKLSEEVSFLNKAAISYTLNHLPVNTDVVIDGTNARYIDYDVVEVIHNFRHNAFSKGIIVQLKNIHSRYEIPHQKDLIYKPKQYNSNE